MCQTSIRRALARDPLIIRSITEHGRSTSSARTNHGAKAIIVSSTPLHKNDKEKSDTNDSPNSSMQGILVCETYVNDDPGGGRRDTIQREIDVRLRRAGGRHNDVDTKLR